MIWSFISYTPHQNVWSVWCKMALAEVGGSLPWCCPALVLLAPGYWSLFLNLIFFSWMMDLGNRPGIRAKYWQLQKKSTYPQLEWYSKDRKLFENVVLRYAIWIWIYEKLREITQDACIMSKFESHTKLHFDILRWWKRFREFQLNCSVITNIAVFDRKIL